MKATTLQLNNCLIGDGLDVNCPSVEIIWNAGSVDKISSLVPETGNDQIIIKFRPLISLPPFVTKKIK